MNPGVDLRAPHDLRSVRDIDGDWAVAEELQRDQQIRFRVAARSHSGWRRTQNSPSAGPSSTVGWALAVRQPTRPPTYLAGPSALTSEKQHLVTKKSVTPAFPLPCGYSCAAPPGVLWPWPNSRGPTLTVSVVQADPSALLAERLESLRQGDLINLGATSIVGQGPSPTLTATDPEPVA